MARILVAVVASYLLLASGAAGQQPGKKSIAKQAQLTEVARFKTEITDGNEILLTAGSEFAVMRGVLGAVATWDVRNRKLLWTRDTDSSVLHLSDAGDEVIWLEQSADSRDIVHIDLRGGQERKRIRLEIEPVKLWNAAFGWSKEPILAAQAEYADRGQIVTFSVKTGKRLSRCNMPAGFDGSETGIAGLGVSADGGRFLVTTMGGVLLCDRSGEVLHRYRVDSHVSRLLFVAGGKRALACGPVFGSSLLLLDLAGGRFSERKEHRFQMVSLAISADGKWAVTGGQCRFAAERDYLERTKTSEGGEVILWDLSTDRPVVKLNPFVDSVKAVGITADGGHIAAFETGDLEGQLVVFKVTRG
jgi:hypothetical protein